MRAAIYFIPKAEDPFYSKGTSFVGYDIRGRKNVSGPEKSKPQNYGFHLTLTDTLDYHSDDIEKLKNEVADCLNCFKPSTRFILEQPSNQMVHLMGEKNDVLVLKYLPNHHLIMLHTLLVARINRLAHDSFFRDQVHVRDQTEQAKILKFNSPYILDNFEPHFTLLIPAPESENAIHRIHRQFKEYTKISIQSICLVTQRNIDDNWIIEHEFEIGQAAILQSHG